MAELELRSSHYSVHACVELRVTLEALMRSPNTHIDDHIYVIYISI